MVEVRTLTVARKYDKYGPAFSAEEDGVGGPIYSAGKFSSGGVEEIIDSLVVGERVEAKISAGKYVKEIRRVGEAVMASTATRTAMTVRSDEADTSRPKDRQVPTPLPPSGPSEAALARKALEEARIARSTAVKALFEGSLMSDKWKRLDEADTMSRVREYLPKLERFILTGQFEDTEDTEVTETNKDKVAKENN